MILESRNLTQNSGSLTTLPAIFGCKTPFQPCDVANSACLTPV